MADTASTLIALISDIHSEAGALEAVVDQLVEQKITRVWCLGDSVDWMLPREPLLRGDPTALRRVRSLAEITLVGNHEFMLLDDPLGSERILDELDGEELLEYLRSLAPRQQVALRGAGVELVHASLVEPYWQFIETEADVTSNFDRTDARLILFGHTHLPFLASQDSSGQVEIERMPSQGAEASLLPDRRYLINPGSIGRGPVGHIATWALLRLDENETPVAVSWQYTPFRAASLFR